MRLDDPGNGITRDSVNFFRDNRHRLGELVTAELRFPGFGDPFDPYLMVLRDGAGNEMRLSGCTTGYHGEGPRAAMLVLVEAGFPATDAHVVFTEPTACFARPNPSRHRPAPVDANPPRATPRRAPPRRTVPERGRPDGRELA